MEWFLSDAIDEATIKDSPFCKLNLLESKFDNAIGICKTLRRRHWLSKSPAFLGRRAHRSCRSVRRVLFVVFIADPGGTIAPRLRS
jgi:hypothetical protein